VIRYPPEDRGSPLSPHHKAVARTGRLTVGFRRRILLVDAIGVPSEGTRIACWLLNVPNPLPNHMALGSGRES